MGYNFFFEGCAISWHSKLHTYVTTSSNHSEYCAGAKAAREAKMFQMLMTELDFALYVSPIDLFSDSQGATAMSYNPVNRNPSKHVDLPTTMSESKSSVVPSPSPMSPRRTWLLMP